MRTRVGYTGGARPEPDYHHLGDHSEAVQVDYDPEVVSYQELLEQFWRSHPVALPVEDRRVAAAIYTHDLPQASAALASQRDVQALSEEQVTTAVRPLDRFWPAEEMHQKFHLKRVLPELAARLEGSLGSPGALRDSTLATRLNAWVGGFGERPPVEEVARAAGITPAEAEALLDAHASASPSPGDEGEAAR